MIEIKTSLAILTTFLTIFALCHILFQLIAFSITISGFSIAGLDIMNTLKKKYIFSIMLILIECFILITLVKFSKRINKKQQENEFEIISLKKKYENDKNKTDLDILYALLKEKKHLRLQTISKAFNVKREIAQEWCKALEEGNLAVLHYPSIGDPEMIVKEE